MKIGFFPITGDVLHAGHVLALEEAKRNCDYLIVGLNCTPSHKCPVQSIYERFTQLKGVRYIDEIIPYGGREDMETLVASLNYDVRFLGADYIGGDWDGKEIEEKLGKEIHFVSRDHKISSTNVKKRIIESYLHEQA